MEIKKIENYQIVYDVRKINEGDNTYISWNAYDCKNFMVIYSGNENNVVLEANEFIDILSKTIKNSSDVVSSYGKIKIPELSVECEFVEFSALKRKIGLSVGNRPGFYAIYGIEILSENDFNILVDNYKDNITEIDIDITIKSEPVYTVKKSLFKKETKIYTGVHKISLDKLLPDCSTGDILYVVDEKRIPFPGEVLNDGGYFFVKTAENEEIRFETKNRGIIIR